MQRLTGSSKIASLVRDIVSHRGGHRPQHVSEFPTARIRLRRFSRQAQADTVAAVSMKQVSQAGANPLPDFGSVVSSWIMIKTDDDDVCRGLQHLVAADASSLFHHSCHRHWQQDRLATLRPRNPEDLIGTPPSTKTVAIASHGRRLDRSRGPMALSFTPALGEVVELSRSKASSEAAVTDQAPLPFFTAWRSVARCSVASVRQPVRSSHAAGLWMASKHCRRILALFSVPGWPALGSSARLLRRSRWPGQSPVSEMIVLRSRRFEVGVGAAWPIRIRSSG